MPDDNESRLFQLNTLIGGNVLSSSCRGVGAEGEIDGNTHAHTHTHKYSGTFVLNSESFESQITIYFAL